jgi:hypothetical protein
MNIKLLDAWQKLEIIDSKAKNFEQCTNTQYRKRPKAKNIYIKTDKGTQFLTTCYCKRKRHTKYLNQHHTHLLKTGPSSQPSRVTNKNQRQST